MSPYLEFENSNSANILNIITKYFYFNEFNIKKIALRKLFLMKKLELEVAWTDLKFEWKFSSIQLWNFLTIQFKF